MPPSASWDRCARLVSRVGTLVLRPESSELGRLLVVAGSTTRQLNIGDGAAQVSSDFRIGAHATSRMLLFKKDLNSYRLSRNVRRIYEIEPI